MNSAIRSGTISAMPFVAALILAVFLTLSAHAQTIRVAAAISLKESLTEIVKSYEAESSDKVEFIFGASGQLVNQIKNGAPIDLFLSAAHQQMKDLKNEKLVDEKGDRVIVTNSLVLVVPSDAKNPPTDFQSLASKSEGKIATGEPRTVPAGMYAKQVFDSLKLSEAVKDRLVFGTNVRQVLTYVERGEVIAGVVYATDARQSGDKIKVVATASKDSHEPIEYPAAVLKNSKNASAAGRFLDYLQSPKSTDLFKAKGFGVPSK